MSGEFLAGVETPAPLALPEKTLPLPALDPGQTELGAAYLAVALHAAHLHTLIARMQRASQAHPHGSEPRTLVFTEEFEAVTKAGANPLVLPVVAEAQRLNLEITALQRARKEADSARAALQRIAADLKVAMEAHELIRAQEVMDAAGAAHDLAQTELQTRPESGSAVYPSVAELSASFFPVGVEDFEQLRPGDVIFEPNSQTVIYQHGNPREVEPKISFPLRRSLRLEEKIVLRPLGTQGVLALRVRLAQQRLKLLAAAEEKIGKPLHNGRAQGMKLAHELLSLPAWSLPAVPLKKNVKPEDAKDLETEKA